MKIFSRKRKNSKWSLFSLTFSTRLKSKRWKFDQLSPTLAESSALAWCSALQACCTGWNLNSPAKIQSAESNAGWVQCTGLVALQAWCTGWGWVRGLRAWSNQCVTVLSVSKQSKFVIPFKYLIFYKKRLFLLCCPPNFFLSLIFVKLLP